MLYVMGSEVNQFKRDVRAELERRNSFAKTNALMGVLEDHECLGFMNSGLEPVDVAEWLEFVEQESHQGNFPFGALPIGTKIGAMVYTHVNGWSEQYGTHLYGHVKIADDLAIVDDEMFWPEGRGEIVHVPPGTECWVDSRGG